MITEEYDEDLVDFDDDLDMDFDDDDEEEEDDIEYDPDEIDEMLDEQLEPADDDDDLAERRRRWRRRRRRRRGRRQRRRVQTAKGRSSYRSPVPRSYVTQKQLKSALSRAGAESRRNAAGIKTVNARIGRLNGRVNGAVSVNRVQSRRINKLNKQMKLDGALEFAQSFDGQSIDVFQLLKGAVKSGVLGDTKGALSNPLVIGGIGLLLRQPGILTGLLSRTTATTPSG